MNAAAPGQSPGQSSGQGTAPSGQAGQNGQSGKSGQSGQSGQSAGQGGQPGQSGQTPQTAQSSQPGQGSASGESPSSGQKQGSGSGESPGTGSGNGSSGDGSGGGGSQQTTDTANATTPPPNSPLNPTPSTLDANQPAPSASTLEAYREAIENLKNQTQQTANLAPKTSTDDLEKTIIRYDKDTSYRPVTPVDIVRFYTDIQKPLEKLIVDLEKLQAHSQRTEIVKTPDLNDTPPAYRPAVSDYFESLSRDYHPPAPPPPAADDSDNKQ